MNQIITELPFKGRAAAGFVLGILTNNFSPEMAFRSIFERVLWRWGPAHLEDLISAVKQLKEWGLIEIIGDLAKCQECKLRLITD